MEADMTYRWTERDAARLLERTGTRGAANTADTSQPPFLPAFGTLKDPYEGMNKLERSYAEHLDSEMGRSIVWWAYEPVRLRLAERTTFTPDFLVQSLSGLLSFFETKGFMRDDAAAKLKIAADMYPFKFFLVKKSKAGWDVTEVRKNRNG
jgi:hypothetical protein